jgi:antitoxin (DNA-binding transcriptional repressor) of toxin-antitoxin stability system
MTTVTVNQATKDFAGTLRHVTSGREAVILKRGRKAVAVMIPPEMIEALQDLEDIQEAAKAMAAHEKGPSRTVPWAQVKREAGLA